MKLRIALEAETIARLRAEWELTAQKRLAANLRNLLNNFVGSQRALELQINTIEGGVEDDPGSSSLGEELASLNMMSAPWALGRSLMQQN